MSVFNCPSCNAANATNARFCTNCGASLSQAETPYSPPTSQSDAALVADYAFAGFWKRLFAYLIDSFLFGGMFLILVMLLGTSLVTDSRDIDLTHFGLALVGIYLIIPICWWLYFAVMESSSSQATLGKKVIGIKVTDISGQPLSFGQATGRHFSAFITQLTFLIGYLLAAFTARKQALHDMIASTLVVNARFGANQIKVASDNPGNGMSAGSIIAIVFLVLLIPVGGILAAIALPAYQDYTMRAKVEQAMVETKYVQNIITEHAAKTGYWPNTLQRAGINSEQLLTENYHLVLANQGSYHLIFKKPETLADSRIAFTPVITKSGSYQWECKGMDIKNSYLPTRCRK